MSVNVAVPQLGVAEVAETKVMLPKLSNESYPAEPPWSRSCREVTKTRRHKSPILSKPCSKFCNQCQWVRHQGQKIKLQTCPLEDYTKTGELLPGTAFAPSESATLAQSICKHVYCGRNVLPSCSQKSKISRAL